MTVLQVNESMKNRILLYVGISVTIFGIINITTEKLANAQLEEQILTEPVFVPHSLLDLLILNLLGQIGPIVGGIVSIGISFIRKQGLKISADAEEYIVNSTKSFVETQSRLIYREIKNNPRYIEYLKNGTWPEELKKKALENVKAQLLVEMQSDEFTRTARQMLQDNLEPLIERFVTEHKDEMSKKTRNMLKEQMPIVIDSVLLLYKTPDEVHEKTGEIVNQALQILEKNFDYENMLFSNEIAETYIRAELNKRVGKIKES
jgi:hypothetical protein